ncbi:MAG: signal peptidase I [Desulfomonile tiedjei]|nr:signal peptidase I [Desulfomonile tiedjei]
MKCPNCGLESPESATKCSCGFDFISGVPAAIKNSVKVGAKRRNPLWAGVLSLVVPGLGQVYNGQVLKGVVFYVTLDLFILVAGLSGLLFNLWGLVAFLAFPFILSAAAIVEAVMTSRRLGSIVLRRYNRWYVYVLLIVIQAVVNHFVWSDRALYRVESYRMPATSMEPTLRPGDHLIARTDYYAHNKPKQSEIVVFVYRGEPSKELDFIKRVVAVEGQKLEIRDKKLFVDDQELVEPWAVHRSPEIWPEAKGPRDNVRPVIVPKGHVFVMGDNREFSHDSRFFGFVDIREITGKPLYIYWADDMRRIGTPVR